MKHRYRITLLISITLGCVYFAGPTLPTTKLDTQLPVVPVGIDSLTQYLRTREAALPVKPDNESTILWADSIGKPTEYVLLYLHGFTASRYEGYPVTHDFVKEFKTNAYLPRLAGHGLMVDEPLLDMTPYSLYQSAKEALVIANKLGQKTIIMGTSTGCTLALMLAADYPELIHGLILYSPNIRIKEKMAPMLSGPWGLQLSRLFNGGNYAFSDDPDDSEESKYWYNRYRIEAQVYLQQLLDMRMNRKEFQKIHQPLFLGIYYKDKDHQDQTIEVKAALKMFNEIATPAAQKIEVTFPNAGAHVIACQLTSQALNEVREQTFQFARNILGM